MTHPIAAGIVLLLAALLVFVPRLRARRQWRLRQQAWLDRCAGAFPSRRRR